MLTATEKPDTDYLSVSDIEILDEVYDRLKGYSARELSNLSHKHPAWINARNRNKYRNNNRLDYKDMIREENIGNTGSIGVAVCGMYVPREVSVKYTKYPLTKIQCERMFKLCADLCKKYNIPITSDTVMTHYEFGVKHPNTTSHHKPDITFLPPYPWVTQSEMGNFIRQKIKWYQNRV